MPNNPGNPSFFSHTKKPPKEQNQIFRIVLKNSEKLRKDKHHIHFSSFRPFYSKIIATTTFCFCQCSK